MKWLKEQSTEFYEARIHALIQKWNIAIERNSDCWEVGMWSTEDQLHIDIYFNLLWKLGGLLFYIYIYIYIYISWPTVVEGHLKAPFSTARRRKGCYSFLGIASLILDPYLIMQIVMQGCTKYHFLSLWFDTTCDGTPFSWAFSEHSIMPMGRYFLEQSKCRGKYGVNQVVYLHIERDREFNMLMIRWMFTLTIVPHWFFGF